VKERKKEKASLKDINRKLQKQAFEKLRGKKSFDKTLTRRKSCKKKKLHREKLSLRGRSGGASKKGDLATIFKCHQSTKG
jgi:hypothetical protein